MQYSCTGVPSRYSRSSTANCWISCGDNLLRSCGDTRTGWDCGYQQHTAPSSPPCVPLLLLCTGSPDLPAAPAPAAGTAGLLLVPVPIPVPSPSPCSPAAAPALRRSGHCHCKLWPGCGGNGGRRARRCHCNTLQKSRGSHCCGRTQASGSLYPSCAHLSPTHCTAPTSR